MEQVARTDCETAVAEVLAALPPQTRDSLQHGIRSAIARACSVADDAHQAERERLCARVSELEVLLSQFQTLVESLMLKP
jgi:hypothetical protein